MYVIKNWSRGRPENEARGTYSVHAIASQVTFTLVYMQKLYLLVEMQNVVG